MGGSRGERRGGASKPFVVLVDKEIHHSIRSGILEKAVSFAQFERLGHDTSSNNPFRFPANTTLQDYSQCLRLPWVHQFAAENQSTGGKIHLMPL